MLRNILFISSVVIVGLIFIKKTKENEEKIVINEIQMGLDFAKKNNKRWKMQLPASKNFWSDVLL